MNIKFEVKMTPKAMFDFMLYTSYTSLGGIIGVILGGVTLVLGIRQCMFENYSTAATFFLFAAIFLIGNPIHLRTRAAEQVKRSPMFQKVMNLPKKESIFHRMSKVYSMNGGISVRQSQPVSR